MTGKMRDVVILGPARTPIGSYLGTLSTIPAPKLGATTIKESLKRAGIEPEQVDEVIMGNVLQGGVGQAPARQAAIFAGLPYKVECMTIHKVCGSGLKSVMVAAQAVAVGDADIIVAGGMESMSMAPYYLFGARTGFRMGNTQLVDGMIHDGLWDVYNNFHMGNAAELCAKKMNITREEQDEYAIESYKRALKAQEEGILDWEIVPVEVPQRKGDPIVVKEDEEPKRVKFEKIPNLRPAFQSDGTITAANASKINDGAATVVVMAAEVAEKLGLKPMARIVAQASFAQAPEDFPTSPVYSVRKVLDKAGMKSEDIDIFEINEAFAVVAIAALRMLEIPHSKMNIYGGAVAFGHPIGASGCRLLVTLLNALKRTGGKKGLVSLCIGGGEASSMIIEML